MKNELNVTTNEVKEMKYRIYAEEVAGIIGDNAEIYVAEKANGVRKVGIRLKLDDHINPTLYINEFFDNGVPVEEAAERIKEAAAEAMENIKDFSLPNVEEYEAIKPNLKVRLYNHATKAEVQMSAAEYGFDDLILVPVIDEIIIGGAAKVTSSMLSSWGKTVEEVVSDAIENLDYVCRPLNEVLKEMMGEFGDTDDDQPVPPMPIFLVTNKSKVCGAASILAAKKEIEERCPNGYIVLPSSVHEVLVVPKEFEDDPLGSIVKEVNETQVSPEDRLSNNIYRFEGRNS